jgi:hypothetical protein
MIECLFGYFIFWSSLFICQIFYPTRKTKETRSLFQHVETAIRQCFACFCSFCLLVPRFLEMYEKNMCQLNHFKCWLTYKCVDLYNAWTTGVNKVPRSFFYKSKTMNILYQIYDITRKYESGMTSPWDWVVFLGKILNMEVIYLSSVVFLWLRYDSKVFHRVVS